MNCQNFSSVSICLCFQDKKRNLSSVRFIFESNVSLQFGNNSSRDIFPIFAFGYLSINVFFADASSDKYNT